MSKISVKEFEEKLESIPEAEPDENDLAMLAEIDSEIDTGTVPLDDVVAKRKYSGRISVRVPKELHRALLEGAKENGVSLNQYVMYKLAK